MLKIKHFNAGVSKKHISYYGEESEQTLVVMLSSNKSVEENDEECKECDDDTATQMSSSSSSVSSKSRKEEIEISKPSSSKSLPALAQLPITRSIPVVRESARILNYSPEPKKKKLSLAKRHSDNHPLRKRKKTTPSMALSPAPAYVNPS